jgi:hypothetical protein
MVALLLVVLQCGCVFGLLPVAVDVPKQTARRLSQKSLLALESKRKANSFPPFLEKDDVRECPVGLSYLLKTFIGQKFKKIQKGLRTILPYVLLKGGKPLVRPLAKGSTNEGRASFVETVKCRYLIQKPRVKSIP